MMARLDFFERFVVVNVLRRVVKVENNFRVAVRQETTIKVHEVKALEVNEMLDKLIERKIRTVHLENHFGKHSPDRFSAPNISLVLIAKRA